MRKIISTIAVGVMAASGLAFMVGGVAQATQDDEQCQHYSWTGGPLDEGQIPPRAPGEGWQANTAQEPHDNGGSNRATWIDGKPGLHYTGTPGNANWFDYVCDTPEPCPTETVIVEVPGPTVTATERVEVPGPTVTATVPGPTVTVTATETAPGATATVTATATVPGPTVTSVVPGPTVTVTAPGAVVTETMTAPAETVTATATETEFAATSPTEGLAKTGANIGTLGWAALLVALGTIIVAFTTRRRGAHE